MFYEEKRRANLAKHGLAFAAAEGLFDDYRLERLDTRQDYGEDRWIALGLIQGNREMSWLWMSTYEFL